MQRYFAKTKENNQFFLEKEDYHHITNVMRMNSGETIEVVYENHLYLCCVQYKSDTVEILCQTEIVKETTSIPSVTLVIPLLKEQKMDYIFQKATELGVDTVIPVTMERSIIKLDSKQSEKKRDRWQKICKEASEQSKRLEIPAVDSVKTWSEIENLQGVKLVASTRESVNTLKNTLKKVKDYDKIICVIGPEGGLSEKEELSLVTRGWIPVTFGTRILRVETVPLYLMSVINYEFME